MKGKIFNAQEVQAILNKSKVMFREVIKPQPIQPEGFSDAYFDCYNKGNQWNWWTKNNKQLLGQIVKCPYQVGQKIFCKEEIAHGGYLGACFVYCADGAKGKYMWQTDWTRHFRPANYMKQEHSRLTLLIKEIKVERLGEISEEDAIAEGVEGKEIEDTPFMEWLDYSKNIFCLTPSESFATLWNATHKKPEEKFEASPWVWVILFEVV